MQLSKDIINLSKEYKTPFLLVDPKQVRTNYKKIQESIPNVEVFYAMKANDHPKIIEALLQENASFEITSLTELKLLLQYNVPPERIVCFNSIKTPDFLQEMYKQHITTMAFDSTDEVDKIAKYAPGSNVVIRIIVDNADSEWPLTKKFGVDAAEALPLLKYAKMKGLNPIGITFHVGSQCLNKNNWVNALYVSDEIWNLAKKEGIDFNFISLGGGIPISHTKPIPSIEEIGKAVEDALQNKFPTKDGKLRVSIEPGRGIVGDAAIMVTTVIGKAKRGNEDWIYIDAGVLNGFMETILEFPYEIRTEKSGVAKIVTIGGPSCDSIDIPFKNVSLPDVELGDKVYIINAGAYTTVYASNFNGFDIPKTYFLER